MLVIVGCLVVVGCVLGGFTWAGGEIHALIHPSEVFTIGGAALGAAIIMSPMKVLVDLAKGMIGMLKSSPFNKAMYKEMFALLYELMRMARKDGVLALESHVENPHDSSVFHKYALISKNHHACDFIAGALAPIVEGSADASQMETLLNAEMSVMEAEHHAPIVVLTKTADGLPGFGIVAAVLGIVITMGAIDGPVEEIGHKVGAALVGTFLGILASYGFLGPMAARMEDLGHSEMAFFKTISSVILAMVNNCAPKVAVEQARRGVGTALRPTRAEMEELFKQVDSGG